MFGSFGSISFNAIEFWRFLRIETCLFISGIAMTGFLLSSNFALTVIYLIFSVICLTGASYAYNHITDKEEDKINNESVNVFAENRWGMPVVAGLFAFGFFVIVLFSPFAAMLYLITIPLVIAYSGMRVKKIFLLKNFYTATVISIVFLIGMAFGRAFGIGMLIYIPVIFMFGFLLNLLGDIRGVAGDEKIGAKTLPTVIGKKLSSNIAIIICLTISIYLLINGLVFFYSLIAFLLLLPVLIFFDKQKFARMTLLLSFFFLPLLIGASMYYGV